MHDRPSTDASADTRITSRLFAFIYLLREHDFEISASEINSAHFITTLPTLHSESLLRSALRTIFCQTQEQWRQFPVLFDSFWWPNSNNSSEHQQRENSNDRRGNETSGLSYFSESLANEKTLASLSDTIDVHSGGASDARTFAQRDFRFVFNPQDMRRIEYIVDDISRRMQKRLTRRTKQHHINGQLNLRQTARKSLQYGGWPFKLYFRRKQRTPARFLLLLDVSQSMEIYSYLFLRFARGLLQSFKDTDAYAFHTELVPIGNELRDKSTPRLESKLKNLSSGWLGGTRIADSLKSFNLHHAKHTLHRNTIVIIFSDGYDSGDPKDLKGAMLKIKSQCRKIVWVNPLLGREVASHTTLPVEKSLQAVLPLLDLYTSAHSLESLRNLEQAFRLK